MKKYIFSILSAAIIIPLVAFSAGNIHAMWNMPQRQEKIEDIVKQQGETQEKIAEVIRVQNAQLDIYRNDLEHQKEIRETEKEFFLKLIEKVQ